MTEVNKILDQTLNEDEFIKQVQENPKAMVETIMAYYTQIK